MKYKNMLYTAINSCACGTKFDTARGLRYHMRSCPAMYCCKRQFGDLKTFRFHNETCHQIYKTDRTPRVSTTNTDDIPTSPKISTTYTCTHCKRDDFKSAYGRDRHTRDYCKEFKLSQAPPELNSAPSVILPDAELPNVTKDPIQPHSVPVRPIPEQKSQPSQPKYEPFTILPRIHLPNTSDKKTWAHLSSCVTTQIKQKLPSTFKQTDDIDIILTSFTDLVSDTLAKAWGLTPERKHNTTSQKPPKHTKAYTKLRAQKRKIRCALKKAIREKADKKYIAKLHFIRRKIIRSLNRIRKYENHINKTKELFTRQTAFNKNPHRFPKKSYF